MGADQSKYLFLVEDIRTIVAATSSQPSPSILKRKVLEPLQGL